MTIHRKLTFTLDTIILVENYLSQLKRIKTESEISGIRRSIYFFLSEVGKEAREITPEDYHCFLFLLTGHEPSDDWRQTGMSPQNVSVDEI